MPTVHSDISNEKDLAHKLRLLNLALEIIEKVNRGLSLEETLNHVYDSFWQLLPYNRIGIALLDDSKLRAEALWSRSDGSCEHINTGYSAEIKGSSLNEILTTRLPRIINDLTAYLAAHPKSESTKRIVAEGFQSSLTCPLIARDQPFGFMFFSSRTKNAYTPEHIEIFTHIAGLLANTLEKSFLLDRQSQLNKRKNQLIGMVSHDLRGGIVVLHGYAELLQGDVLREESERQRIYRRMLYSCKSMLKIINNSLDISAIESGHLQLRLEDVNLSELLKDIAEDHRFLADLKSIHLNLHFSSDELICKADPQFLTQIINNLLDNAIKFSHTGSTIDIVVCNNGDWLEIDVRDRGQGISAEDLAKLFTQYGRGSARPTAGEKTTGLGLMIVHKLVEAHQGQIHVQSTPGSGTTFTVRLPTIS